MVFSSTEFLCFFLPIVLMLYYLCRRNRTLSNVVLTVMSLLFYAWGEPTFVLVMLASIFINWLAARVIDGNRERPRARKLALIAGLVLDVGMLAVFKYLSFFVRNLNGAFSLNLPDPQLALPIGISFFTFQAISYIVDVYRGHGEAQKHFLGVCLYISFFPQLIAGPIVRYETVAAEIKGRTETLDDFTEGARRFMVGLSKKAILANSLALIVDSIFALSPEKVSVAMSWYAAIAYLMQVYYDFSGYSDMAIGLGRMFGFHFLENFTFPFLSKSVTEFWRRWHISLSTWFRDYVYIPLGGNRCSRARNVWNLFVVWFLTGMWHGASWNFIAWGLWFFVLLVGEKLLWGKALERLPSLVRHAYAMVLVVFSWVLFRAETLTAAAAYFAAMFGSSGVWCGSRVVYYALEFWPELLCCCIAALPVKQWLETALQKRDAAPARAVLTWGPKLAAMALLACSYCKLVTGSFNPFIYFRF